MSVAIAAGAVTIYSLFAAVVRCVRREIFGPILPILAVDDIDEAIRVINSKWVILTSAPDIASESRPAAQAHPTRHLPVHYAR